MQALKKFSSDNRTVEIVAANVPAFSAQEDLAHTVVCLLVTAGACKDHAYAACLIDQSLEGLLRYLAGGARSNDLLLMADCFEKSKDFSPSSGQILVALLRAAATADIPAAFLPGAIAAVLEARRRAAIIGALTDALDLVSGSVELLGNEMHETRKPKTKKRATR